MQKVVIFLSVLLLLGFTVESQRYEFKHSFKSPFYLGRGGSLPFWEFGGSTMVSEDSVRLTPTFQSRSGWIWNTVPADMDSWEVQISFKIAGGGKTGADGFVMWYTAESKQTGYVLGSKDYWTGLGIFFDSFDNDNLNDNPKIYGIFNNGHKPFNPGTDGTELAIGSCAMNFRNRYVPNKAKITYKSDMLQVQLDIGNSWETCFTTGVPEDLRLSRGGYFGLSAATGELFDNHDIYSFVTYNLDPPPQGTTAPYRARYNSPSPLPTQATPDQPNPSAPFKNLVSKLQNIAKDEDTNDLKPKEFRKITEVLGEEPQIRNERTDNQNQGNQNQGNQNQGNQNQGNQNQAVNNEILEQLQEINQRSSNPVNNEILQQLQTSIQEINQRSSNAVNNDAIQKLQRSIEDVNYRISNNEGLQKLQTAVDDINRQQQRLGDSFYTLTTQISTLKTDFSNPRLEQDLNDFKSSVNRLSDSVLSTNQRLTDAIDNMKRTVEKDVAYLRSTISEIRSTLSRDDPTQSRLVQVIDDVKKGLLNVERKMEEYKREQSRLAGEIKDHSHTLGTKIEVGTSSTFSTYFIIFLILLILGGVGGGFFWWKAKGEGLKKFS